MTLPPDGALRLEFDSDPWDSTISFASGIPVALGGTLELTFAPDVDIASNNGRTIDLFDWIGVSPTGAFTVESPYTWNLSKLYTTGEVTLLAAPILPGDFDNDGDVDGRDFLAWQRNPSIGDLADWQATYEMGTMVAIALGHPAATVLIDKGASPAASPVPESASLVLVGMVLSTYGARKPARLLRRCRSGRLRSGVRTPRG